MVVTKTARHQVSTESAIDVVTPVPPGQSVEATVPEYQVVPT